MMYYKFLHNLIFCSLLFATVSSYAKGTYQEPEEFISLAFNQQVPEAQVIWLDNTLRVNIENILQHKYKAKRVRYWKQGTRSVWILEEIGKKKPITTGIIIDDKKISQLKVLVFRETRGWEVRYPFFSQQFEQLFLTPEHNLSSTIDGISGATLSVRALEKLARIALLLDHQIQQKENPAT